MKDINKTSEEIRFKEWMNFLESDWLNKESVRQHFLWGDDIESTGQKDSLGIPLLKRPGFRPKEKNFIINQSDKATEWLNQVTNKYGIHWEIIYLEPNESETDSPEGFQLYKDRSTKIAREKMSELGKDFKPIHPDDKPPNPGNTIVYVKPTSRVHQLSSHQQVHNIGHAVWGYAKLQRSAFALRLQRIVESIRRRIEKRMFSNKGLEFNKYGENQNHSKWEIERKKQPFHQVAQNMMNSVPATPASQKSKNIKIDPNDLRNDAVTQEEIILVISRLVNLKSMKRMFTMSPEDFADPKKAINQVYGSWDEFLYELVAAFFRGGGRINLRPQDDLKGKLTPTSGIQQHPTIKSSPKDWAWDELFDDQHFWNNVSDELTLIVVAALYECTYGKIGRPIYATYGGLPQT
jgi:hypothetical protein